MNDLLKYSARAVLGLSLVLALPSFAQAQNDKPQVEKTAADKAAADKAATGRAGDKTPAGARGKPALTVRLVSPEQSQLPTFISVNGNVAAWQDMVVGSELSGVRLKDVNVQIGDRVRKGQILAQHVTETIELELSLAQAALAEAEAAAMEAKRNADAVRGLTDTTAVSGLQTNQVLTQELTTQARVRNAQAQVDLQKLRLRNARVVAPDDGIVSQRTAVAGSVPLAGQELFRLIRKGRLEWRGELTSQELARVKAGQKVLLTGNDGQELQASIRTVAPTIDPASRVALVYADLPESARLVPGTFVRGRIQMGDSAARLLPEAAVVQRDGFRYVFVLGADRQTVRQVKVETGRRDGQRVEILSGLADDAQVVSTGAGFLADGDVVRVVQ